MRTEKKNTLRYGHLSSLPWWLGKVCEWKKGILSITEEQNDPEQGDATWSADNGYVEVIVISVHSVQIDCNLFAHYSEIVELVQFLFTVPGVQVFLSRRLCQDPLEKFFGCQRQKGGAHDNPNVAEFLNNMQVLQVVNLFCQRVARGNCRGAEDKTQRVTLTRCPYRKDQQNEDQRERTSPRTPQLTCMLYFL